eukprot:s3284_g1.t1
MVFDNFSPVPEAAVVALELELMGMSVDKVDCSSCIDPVAADTMSVVVVAVEVLLDGPYVVECFFPVVLRTFLSVSVEEQAASSALALFCLDSHTCLLPSPLGRDSEHLRMALLILIDQLDHSHLLFLQLRSLLLLHLVVVEHIEACVLVFGCRTVQIVLAGFFGTKV